MAAEATSSSYVVEYLDGPLEGQVEHRSLVDGAPESRLATIAAVDGNESVFWYDLVEQRDFDGEVRATFAFDAGDSDPVTFDEDDND
ncbi:hypothetical protein [Agromyces salentinus]|uniref:Uncharacterized protein n=1 Tax=Agromyces salentinus TaxID=269421 RepID=A0ABN2MN04_9MICO|nr:hypothetical protein [Agromyces salentinus]